MAIFRHLFRVNLNVSVSYMWNYVDVLRVIATIMRQDTSTLKDHSDKW